MATTHKDLVGTGFYWKTNIKSNGRYIKSYVAYADKSRLYLIGDQLFYTLAAAREYTRNA
jgi:hypothetical protein